MSNKNYKLIVFDLADVLAQIWKIRAKAFLATGEECGWKPKSIEQLEKVWGEPLIDMAKALWPGKDESDYRDFVSKYASIKHKPEYSIEEVPGAADAVRKIVQKGYYVAVLTSVNGQTLEDNLQDIGMADIDFVFCQSSDDTEFHKPHPAVFDPVMKKAEGLDIRKDEMLYVGDAMRDWQACRQAGIPFIAVLTGAHEKEDFIRAGVSEPRILESVTELPSWVS